MKNLTKVIASIIGGVCVEECFRGMYKSALKLNIGFLGKVGAAVVIPAIGFVCGYEATRSGCIIVEEVQKVFEKKYVTPEKSYDDTITETVKETDSQK